MVSSLIGGPGWLPGGEGDGVAGPSSRNRPTFPFLFAMTIFSLHFLYWHTSERRVKLCDVEVKRCGHVTPFSCC